MRRSILALTLFAPLASAAVGDSEVAACAAETNTVKRLSCYDSMAAKHELAPATKRTKAQGAGKWQTQTSTDPLNDKSVHVAILDADTGAGRYGETVSMVVRCKDNRTELYINWNSFLGGDGIQSIHRVGKAKAVQSMWTLSTDKQSAFYPGTPIPVLKKMADESSFIVNVTPYNSNPVTAIFDITGAESALSDIREGCTW